MHCPSRHRGHIGDVQTGPAKVERVIGVILDSSAGLSAANHEVDWLVIPFIVVGHYGHTGLRGFLRHTGGRSWPQAGGRMQRMGLGVGVGAIVGGGTVGKGGSEEGGTTDEVGLAVPTGITGSAEAEAVGLGAFDTRLALGVAVGLAVETGASAVCGGARDGGTSVRSTACTMRVRAMTVATMGTAARMTSSLTVLHSRWGRERCRRYLGEDNGSNPLNGS